jgi:hypothetical protein
VSVLLFNQGGEGVTVLDADVVVRACKQVGFRYGGGLDIMVAVGKAESKLDERVISAVNSDGTVDIGWPQINSGHLPGGKYRTLATDPEAAAYARDTLGHPWSQEDLRVCLHAALAAWVISRHGTNFAPWVTFNSGAFRDHMALAQTARNLVDERDQAELLRVGLADARDRMAATRLAVDGASSALAAAREALG